MNLTKEKLLSLWRNRKEIFDKESNKYIVNRFDTIENIFSELVSDKYVVTEDSEGRICLNGKLLTFKMTFKNKSLPSNTYFACKEDGTTSETAYEGVEIQAQTFPEEYSDIIRKIGCMLGGFDFDTHKYMRSEFRIISNIVTKPRDDGSLLSQGQARHPSSHFADNNYFFNVANTVRKIKDNVFETKNSRLVLRWPNDTYYKDGDVEAEKSQKEALKYRFPYKFFYCWTHDVLRPVSLLVYKGFVQQKDKDIAYLEDQSFCQSFESFTENWQEYSNRIKNLIPEDERGSDFWNEVSKLISIIMIEDQPIRNLNELLTTGNKAIILYGPPGTGKTYTAENLVCEMLKIEREQLDGYKFSSDETKIEGAWTLVQFHPNYTYEDFIGGISPELSNNNLSYTLKTGIFKRFCDVAAKPENKEKSFIFVIDEINRADLSAVFGELMYGLEYRGKGMRIPNFDKQFVIPDNVYLIGTMNNIDKSLVTFDLALRRRFAFYKIMPNLNVIEAMLENCNIEESCLSAFIARCKDLNKKLSETGTLQLGEDYQIGHAYYGKIRDFLRKISSKDTQTITTFELEKLWEYHLEPLLMEYVGNRMEDPDVVKRIQEFKDVFNQPLA